MLCTYLLLELIDGSIHRVCIEDTSAVLPAGAKTQSRCLVRIYASQTSKHFTERQWRLTRDEHVDLRAIDLLLSATMSVSEMHRTMHNNTS